MNVETVLQGLAITLIGMSLVFLALGLIVAAMVLMGRYLQPRAQEGAASGPPSAPADAAASGPAPEAEDRARVAAMAAAIVLAGARDKGYPGGRDEGHPGNAWRLAGAAPSPWQAAHRSQTLAQQPGRTEEGGACP